MMFILEALSLLTDPCKHLDNMKFIMHLFTTMHERRIGLFTDLKGVKDPTTVLVILTLCLTLDSRGATLATMAQLFQCFAVNLHATEANHT